MRSGPVKKRLELEKRRIPGRSRGILDLPVFNSVSMSTWAIDLGTTNTGIARWNPSEERVMLKELTAICRKPGRNDPLEAPRLVPSATHVEEEPGFWAGVANWPMLRGRVFWGRFAHIGRPALEMNSAKITPNFAPTFKPYLSHEALRPIARVGGTVYTARDVAHIFLRELFAEVKRQTGDRIDDLVNWSFADGIYSQDFDHLFNLNKIRKAGWREVVDSEEMLLRLLGDLRRMRIIP